MDYGVSAMQGRRTHMEDAHIVDGRPAGFEDHTIFAVFDGHGGDYVARFVALNFLYVLEHSTAWFEYTASRDPKVAGEAMREAFLAIDAAVRTKLPRGDFSGCTANVCLVTPKHVICANAGDSRAVIKLKDDVEPMSFDHKPSDKIERARIEKARGMVCNITGRVNGSLAVARALGDFEYKMEKHLKPEQQQVSPEPDVKIHERSADDELLVVACDGIWDVMDNRSCANFAKKCLDKLGDQLTPKEAMGKACETVLDKGYNLGSGDNMSIILVAL